ncbi:MAG: E1 ubiquitin-activating protein uba2 [Pleopsidium flavum]|nr:MAG: E1 ubiquitin-activating protein uba2 [Pleopsidium flavum]
MLRLQYEGSPEELSCLHDTEYTKPAHTLHTKEIENLRRESQALKKIRGSMGSEHFPRKVFEKVYKEDIERLRTMEEMWKTRRPPEALDFDKMSQDAPSIDLSVATRDQSTWTLQENFVVFTDSLRRLSKRLQAIQAVTAKGDAPPILTFDKDDIDTLDFVASSANLRSIIFGIEAKSKFDIKQMAGNIIPAIATTNAMTAGLCVLQAFKVLRDDLHKAKMVFLEHSAARVINTDTLKPPNPDCTVCGVTQSTLVVDTSRATLSNLVEDVLRLQLGYGDEFSINNEVGTLYDPELDDNLQKKFSDLGIKGDSFLTVIDDDDENPRVNLSFSISEKALPEESKPILVPQKLEVARKPKSISAPTTNGAGNRVPVQNGFVGKRKRNADEADLDEQEQTRKRGKLQATTTDNDLIVLDDSSNGAIVID